MNLKEITPILFWIEWLATTRGFSFGTAFRLESKPCKGFVLQINFPPMRALEFITDHVTFKLPYN